MCATSLGEGRFETGSADITCSPVGAWTTKFGGGDRQITRHPVVKRTRYFDF
jgi:hypothetical protein